MESIRSKGVGLLIIGIAYVGLPIGFLLHIENTSQHMTIDEMRTAYYTTGELCHYFIGAGIAIIFFSLIFISGYFDTPKAQPPTQDPQQTR